MRRRHLAISHVDTERTAVEVLSVEHGDSVLSSGLVGELTEAESLRAASLTVDHETAISSIIIYLQDKRAL